MKPRLEAEYIAESATPQEVLRLLEAHVPGLIWKLEIFKEHEFLIEGLISRSLTKAWYDYRVVQVSIRRPPAGFDPEGVLSGIFPDYRFIFGTFSSDHFETLNEVIAQVFRLLEAHAVVP